MSDLCLSGADDHTVHSGHHLCCISPQVVLLCLTFVYLALMTTLYTLDITSAPSQQVKQGRLLPPPIWKADVSLVVGWR